MLGVIQISSDLLLETIEKSKHSSSGEEMAELGNLLGASTSDDSSKAADVQIEWLDYAYVEECSDVKRLRVIVDALNSGEYGCYPDLVAKAEDKMVSLLPEKERLRVQRLRQKATPRDVSIATDDLKQWQQSVGGLDAKIKAKSKQAAMDGDASGGCSKAIFDSDSAPLRKLPPVRGAGGGGAANAENSGDSSNRPNMHVNPAYEQATAGAGRISGYNFRAWEKFDVDGALEAIDEEDKLRWVLANHSFTHSLTRSSVRCPLCFCAQRVAAAKDAYSRYERTEEDARARRRKIADKEMANVFRELRIEELSEVQRSARANREKLKGNESFRVGENDESLRCYTRSIALDPTSAVVFANRAMTSIRLERFEAAEDDCTAAIALDPAYSKAWTRRGMTRFKRGKYAPACWDFYQALKLEAGSPASAQIEGMLQNARAKYREVEGRELPGLAEPPGRLTASVSAAESLAALALLHVEGVEVARGVCGVRPSAAKGFTRVAIEEEDSEEEGEVEVEAAGGVAPEHFTKVQITEDEEEEEEEEKDKAGSADATALNEEGNRLFAAGRAEEALAAYSACLAAKPSRELALAASGNRAMALISLGRYAEAIDDCSHVLLSDPGNVKALYRRGLSRQQTGALALAREDALRAVAADPRNAQAQALLREVEMELARSQEAEAEEGEMSVERLKGQMQAAVAAGGYDEAVSLSQEAIRQIDSCALGARAKLPFLLSQGTCLSAKGAHSSAAAAYSAILAVDPGHFKATQKRAGALILAGDLDGARRDLVACHKIDAADRETLALMEQLESARGSAAEAEAEALKDRGNDLVKAGDYARAVQVYSRALELPMPAACPAALALRGNRAQALLKTCRFSEAENDCSFVLASDGAARKDEGAVYSALGRKALYRRALARRSLGGAAAMEAALHDLDALLADEPDNKQAAAEKLRTLTLIKDAAPAKAAESSEGLTEVRSYRRAAPAEAAGAPQQPAFVAQPPAAPSAKKKAPVASQSAALSPLSKASIAVPSDAPKTVYELERVWRGLKGHPDLFAQYLGCFKKSTYKKVFKESVSPDLLSSLFQTLLSDHCPAAVAATSLEGLAEIGSFGMTLSLLPAEDLLCVGDVLEKLEGAMDGSALRALRDKYKM